MIRLFIVTFFMLFTHSWGYITDPGPQVKASIGEVWPKPKYQAKTDNYFILDPNNFTFVATNYTCDILDQAFQRYTTIIKNIINSPLQNEFNFATNPNAVVRQIDQVTLNLTSPCEHRPHLKMDEWYYVTGSGRIITHSVWGALRALETFSQLLTPYVGREKLIHIPDIRIRDSPRFSHRGLLLDTSRHFISMENIYTILDGMSYNKLNVFHWHIVDDQSFPYTSVKFPELIKGAYSPKMVYSQKDVADVIEYARLRGIRTLPEFDVPGHTRSWGVSHPEILTECEGEYKGKMGPINPIKNVSYEFLEEFFKEIIQVFPEKYIHIGGDEVGFECWNTNTEIKAFVAKYNLTYTELQKEFMERITKFILSDKNTPIVWQEAMVENNNMPKETVVQVWTGNWRNLLFKFTADGYRVLMSECWYLDHLSTGGDWLKYYRCEPHNFDGSDEQKRLIIGGEACMWSEAVSDRNVLQRIFPRVSAVAERLWSSREVTNTKSAQERIEEHTCRMILRGVPAQPPNGPGIC